MKKTLTIALVVLFAVCSLYAEVNPIVSVKTYFTGNNIPMTDFSYDDVKGHYVWTNVADPDGFNNLNEDWWMKRQDYWMLAYEKTSMLDLGLEAHAEGFNFVTRMDIMQDVLANLQDFNTISTNIPFIGSLIDLTLPRLGFVDWTSQNEMFFVSAGRRLIKWGPGSYDLTIADSQPYLDNVWAEFRLPMQNNWNFNYNYVVVAPKTWMDYNDSPAELDVQKTIFAHKWSFYNDNFKVTIGELNNVYGKDPNFLDASPLIIWHDSNQDDYSNVFLHLALEGKVGPVRGYFEFAMDDFDLPHETHSSKPQAMGFSAGVEYHVFDGEDNGKASFDRRDYTLKEHSFKVENGLNIGAEWYYVSPLMYNRNSSFNGAGKFTIPFQFISLVGAGYVYDYDAYYLGFKYGPNSQLFRFYAEYVQKPFEAYFSAELLTRGAYGIESTYGDRNKLDALGMADSVMKMCGDRTTALLLDFDFAYYLDEAFKLQVGFDWQRDLTHEKSAYKLNIGMSINPVDVDWKNLF